MEQSKRSQLQSYASKFPLGVCRGGLLGTGKREQREQDPAAPPPHAHSPLSAKSSLEAFKVIFLELTVTLIKAVNPETTHFKKFVWFSPQTSPSHCIIARLQINSRCCFSTVCLLVQSSLCIAYGKGTAFLF